MAESSYPSAQDPNKQSFKENLGNFKKFASTSFTRARQYATEKIGRSDAVTELDSDVEDLSVQLNNIKTSTEKILALIRILVQPDPSARLEDWALTKLDKPTPQRFNTYFSLSTELAKTGTTFGSDTQYGSYLLHCADVEGKIGEATKRFYEKTQTDFIAPLKAFLEIDVKQVMREKKTLKVKRLDLDAARNKANRVQADKLQSAEAELRAVQADYDMQLEKVRSQLRKIVDTHVNHMGHLCAFMAAQRAYSTECQVLLSDIQTATPNVSSAVNVTKSDESGTFNANGIELDREEKRNARLLYDYDAEDDSGLSFAADDVITVIPIPDDDEYMMAEVGGKFGKIPSTYVELL